MALPTSPSTGVRRGSNQFQCDSCGKCFSTKGNLLRHKQAVHIGGQAFPCPLCGKVFKRKEDMITHTRIHTGEKPYSCKHPGCGKRFARNSDLRSHERTHDVNTKAYPCKYPDCGKTFTRPYDLKKHDLQQHQGQGPRAANAAAASSSSTPAAGAPAANASSVCDRSKRGIADMNPSNIFGLDKTTSATSGEFIHAGVQNSVPTKVVSLSQNSVSPGAVNFAQHHAMGSLEPLGSSRMETKLEAPRPTQTPRFRKRVRCDAHKHHEELLADDGAETALKNARVAVLSQGAHGLGGAIPGAAESKVHFHGASCGHMAVLHDNHVDFLRDGHLECFEGKQRTREGWVSFNDGKEANCDCPTKPASKAGEELTITADVHWDGDRNDEPRGACTEDTTGTQGISNLIVHHDGHVDYVVKGRLMHPVHDGPEESQVTKFEDHGSIRALGNDFLTFYETLDVLSENADRAVESYCDLCDRGQV